MGEAGWFIFLRGDKIRANPWFNFFYLFFAPSARLGIAEGEAGCALWLNYIYYIHNIFMLSAASVVNNFVLFAPFCGILLSIIFVSLRANSWLFFLFLRALCACPELVEGCSVANLYIFFIHNVSSFSVAEKSA